MSRLLQYYNNLSFRKKMLLACAIVLMIPLLIIFLVLNRQFYDRQTQQVLADIRVQVNEHIDQINRRTEQAVTAARLFTYNNHIIRIFNKNYSDFYELVKNYREYVTPLFQTLSGITPELVRWRLYTTSPLQFYQASFAQDLSALKNQPWFENAMIYHQIVWFLDEGQPCLCMQQNSNIANEQQNLFVFYYDKNKLFDGIELLNLNHIVVVTDESGQKVYQSGMMQGMAALEDNFNEEDFVIMNGQLAANSWQIRYLIPRSMLFDASNRNSFLQIFVASELGLIIAGILMSRNLIHRLELLNRQVKSVVSDGSAIDLHMAEHDEIGELANSIATMLDETQRLTREAYEKELALQEAKFLVLQTQIKPHFLYNTLSLINWHAIKRGDHEISQLALMLAQFYRSMLNHGDTMTTAREEWLGMEAYLHIQMIFHNRSFETDLYLNESASECIVPNLILQPLVENAIHHGIDKLEDRRGFLSIHGEYSDGRIHFEISDNGPGFPENVLKSLPSGNGDHYCLKNINERLTLIYADDYVFRLKNRREGGATVTLDLPCIPRKGTIDLSK